MTTSNCFHHFNAKSSSLSGNDYISTFKEQPLRNTRMLFFTTETCCEHTKHTGIPFTSVKMQEMDQISWKPLHSLSHFLFFNRQYG